MVNKKLHYHLRDNARILCDYSRKYIDKYKMNPAISGIPVHTIPNLPKYDKNKGKDADLKECQAHNKKENDAFYSELYLSIEQRKMQDNLIADLTRRHNEYQAKLSQKMAVTV